MFCSRLPGGDATTSMPASPELSDFGQAHFRGAAAKDRVERFGEVVVDGVERLLEFFARDQVELGDGLLRVGDRLQQVVALARQEREALLALVELFERHHVHRAHRFDARLHLAVVGFGDRQLFAGDERRFGGDQVFGLRVDFRHAGFAQVLAVGVVARALDFGVAALFAQSPAATGVPGAADLPSA